MKFSELGGFMDEIQAIHQHLGGRIKHVRQLRGLTQAQLSDLMEINQVSLSRYERGKRAISLYWLLRIAHALEEYPFLSLPAVVLGRLKHNPASDYVSVEVITLSER